MPLDIGIGIIMAIVASELFRVQLNFLLVLVGVIGALAPDFDYIVHLLQGGTSRNEQHHRELDHYPLLFVPIIGIIGWYLGGAPWSFLLAIGSLLHFIHDSIGVGWGVAWLFPFTTDAYSFFYLFQPPHKPSFSKRLVYVWRKNDIERLQRDYGDEEWLRNVYFSFHPLGIFEYAVMISSLGILVWYCMYRS